MEKAPSKLFNDDVVSEISCCTAYKNLFILGFLFFCIFTGFQSLQNLQSSIHSDANLGFGSLSVVYMSLVCSCLLVSPSLINKFGCKYTIVFSTIGYISYTTAHFYPTSWSLIPVSVLLGLCAAPLWTAKATYISTTARNYSKSSGLSVDAVMTNFFGIFFTMFQCSQVVGNSISSIVLKPCLASYKPHNTSYSCGASFCPSTVIPSVKQQTNHSTVVNLMIIYLLFGIFGAVIALVFLDEVKVKEKYKHGGCTASLILTFQSFRDWRMIFLLPLNMYSGLSIGFIFGDFTKAYITCAVGIQKIGFVMIAFGISNAVSSLFVASFAKWLPRYLMILFVAIFQSCLIVWLYLWNPLNSPLSLFFLSVAMWGSADAIWQTQVHAFYGVLFYSKQEIAYSVYKLFQSLGFVVTFAYGNILCVTTKLYILQFVLIFGVLLYGIVEYAERKKNLNNSILVSKK